MLAGQRFHSSLPPPVPNNAAVVAVLWLHPRVPLPWIGSWTQRLHISGENTRKDCVVSIRRDKKKKVSSFIDYSSTAACFFHQHLFFFSLKRNLVSPVSLTCKASLIWGKSFCHQVSATWPRCNHREITGNFCQSFYFQTRTWDLFQLFGHLKPRFWFTFPV